MKIFFYIIIILFSSNVLGETYFCEFKEQSEIKKISFHRVTHSHFKTCSGDQCENYKLSVIYADNNKLIIGDIINRNNNEENFYLFIIDKNTNLFSAANIQLPNNNVDNKFFNGICINK